MKRMHRAVTPKLSRPVNRYLPALAGLQARAIRVLRSMPEQLPFVAVANGDGYSPGKATRASRHHRAKAFPAQLVPALARRRRQMLVSQWALPLSEGLRGLGGNEPRGSGVGGVHTVPRLPTAVTPNPSIEGTASGLRPPAAPHVKR